MQVKFEVQGAKQIAKAIGELPLKVQKKHMKTALRAGAKITLTRARADAPSLTGFMRKKIRIRAGKTTRQMVSVLVSVAKKWFAGTAFYAGFVEQGHIVGKRLKQKFKGADRREKYRAAAIASGRQYVEGRHFMAIALNDTASQALDVAEKTLVELIESEKLS